MNNNKQKAVFIDRDGVISKEVGYLQKIANTLNTVVFILLCYVFISIGTINPTAEISLALATLLSIGLTLTNIRPILNSLSKEHFTLFYLLIVYVGIGILTYFTHELTDRALSKIGTSLHFALIIFPILTLSTLKISKKIFWLSIILGAVINFISAFYQSQYLGIRSHGEINAILFGDISLLLGFMSAISYTYFKRIKFRFGTPISLLGLICGIGASLLSQSRGGWIAIPFLILTILIYMYHQERIEKKQLVVLFSVAIISIAFALYLGWDFIGNRIETAIQQFSDYFKPGNNNTHTSVGARLEIWRGALLLINDYPLLGAGIGGWQDIFAIQTTEGRMLNTSHYVNIHNQILQEGVDKGLIGIASYLALNIYLFHYFLSNIKKKSINHEFHLVGLLLIVGYFIFGFTNIVFNHGVFNTFFVAMLAIVFTFTVGSKNKS